MLRPVDNRDKLNWSYSLIMTFTFVGLMWLVYFVDRENQWGLNAYGMRPQSSEGLWGILTMPFLHANIEHLVNNTVTMVVFMWALFYFYRQLALKVFLYIWGISHFWLWIFGEQGTLIVGASGIIFGLGFFLFVSGTLRKHTQLMGVSMAMLFLYGSMVWGVFPNPINPNISWLGHLCGAIAGLLLAFYFRKEGPQRKLYQYEIDEIREARNPSPEPEFPYWMHGTYSKLDEQAKPLNVRYIYVPKQAFKQSIEFDPGKDATLPKTTDEDTSNTPSS